MNDVEAAIAGLRPGDRLELEAENDNEADPSALRIVASLHGQRLGYVPRFLCSDIRALQAYSEAAMELTVAHINIAPTPKQFRLLCQLNAPWIGDFSPFAGTEFAPIVTAAV